MDVTAGLLLSVGLVFFSLAYGGASLALVLRNSFPRGFIGFNGSLLILMMLVWTMFLSIGWIGTPILVWQLLVMSLVLLFPLWFMFPRFHMPGRFFMLVYFLLTVYSAGYGLWFLLTIPVSDVTRVMMLLGLPMMIVVLPSSLVQFFEQFEILCHHSWERPKSPLRIDEIKRFPKVSLHVPAHAEPPDIVIETLNALSKLDYPNFEVLLLDNNTEDENLWKPVEAHCRELGKRFRFIRLVDWPGAKAGALNHGIKIADPEAELIGVIDADYVAHPMFLKTLVGYFENPEMGFVQTPHDYRDWQDNTFLRGCYYEYSAFFKTEMVSLNERNAGITVGTMCVIRKKALVEAGGWSEWCLTEDSELAIRIHALGYSSVFTTTSLGRGLIPETFEGYKKQRFRWTAGPIQEVKRHFKMLSPWSSEKTSFSMIQKVEHINHGLKNVTIGVGVLLVPLGLMIAASMIYHGEEIPVPPELWLGITVLMVSNIVLKFYMYNQVMGANLADSIRGMIASSSLNYVMSLASVKALFINSFAWQRTDKFKALPAGLAALGSAAPEFLLAMICFGAAGLVVFLLPSKGLLMMLAIGFVLKGLTFLTAPYMALLAERALRRKNL